MNIQLEGETARFLQILGDFYLPRVTSGRSLFSCSASRDGPLSSLSQYGRPLLLDLSSHKQSSQRIEESKESSQSPCHIKQHRIQLTIMN